MSRGPSTFRRRDVTAAVKAVVAAGVTVVRIKIARDGTIQIDTSDTSDRTQVAEGGSEQWDDALK
jgi:hypothetical protein